MKVPPLLLVFFCFASSLFAQNNLNETTPLVSLRQAKTASEIAAYINHNYQSDHQKILAIYSWIVNNIRYDNDSLHFVVLDEDNEQRASYALRRRKGVCENFAAIFNELSTKCGIPSFVISGFTKEGGGIAREGHAWCAAFVDDQWNLYDPTWDAVSVGKNNGNYNYFKVAPSVFIETHLPFDPLFQFLNYPATYKDFTSGMEGRKTPDNYFNYMDSLKNYEKMDRISQYRNQEARIESTKWPASKVDTKLKTVQFQREVLSQDDDAELYNSAVNDYNQAVNALNVFLVYRNNQFKPVKTLAEVSKIFENVSLLIKSANLRLQKISRSTATLQLDTGDIQKKINDLQGNLQVQELFYKNYIAKSPN